MLFYLINHKYLPKKFPRQMELQRAKGLGYIQRGKYFLEPQGMFSYFCCFASNPAGHKILRLYSVNLFSLVSRYGLL